MIILGEQEIQDIVSLYLKKTPLKNIAKKYNVTCQAISFHLKKRGVFVAGHYKIVNNISSLEKDRIIELYKNGLDFSEIVQFVNRKEAVIRRLLKHWGVELEGSKRRTVSKKLGLSDDSLIQKYLEFSKDAVKTANFFRISRPTVLSVVRKNKIQTSNEDYYDLLNQNKEYIINSYNNKIGIPTLSKELGIKCSSFYLAMRRWGVKLEYPGVKELNDKLENDKNLIYKLYYVDYWSYKEIAINYNTSTTRISNQFKKWKWEGRDSRYIESSLERKFKIMLAESNIKFNQHFILNNRVYDFYLSDFNLLIETNGDYWHGNPKKYTILNLEQSIGRKRDDVKLKIARDLNYSILFLWEDEILNHKEAVLSILRNLKEKIPFQTSSIDFVV